MSQAYDENRRTPVTIIKAGPCVVTKINTNERDRYSSVQIGFGEKKVKNITKPMQGHLNPSSPKASKGQGKYPRFLKEVKGSDVKIGDVIMASDLFSEGDTVNVSGVSKGKGFAGVVKRWSFAGGPKTHGQSDRWRAPGSIGQGTTPGRVRKGKKMAGRMGSDRIQVSNLKVLKVDSEKNELWVNGPVPGSNKGLLEIKLVKTALQAAQAGGQEGEKDENK